jgi:transcriptional regulator GlxA family with amidase domain
MDAMQIALVLYPGFTALDIIGPFQVLVDIPGHDTVFVAAKTGPVPDHTGRCPLVASRTFADTVAPDVIVVPGGNQANLGPVVEWLNQVHPTATWTTSVCTGSLYLAAARLLDGLAATTHWRFADQLEQLGATYTEQRVVVHDKIITAAGVSSGIDMALTLVDRLHGPLIAQAIQLAIEYDPQPPFDSGAPSKAPAEVLVLLDEFYNAIDSIAAVS